MIPVTVTVPEVEGDADCDGERDEAGDLLCSEEPEPEAVNEGDDVEDMER